MVLNIYFLAASDYDLEEEAREYVNSIHIEDDPVDKYSLTEQHQQHLQEDLETEIVVEETPIEEASPSIQSVPQTLHEPPAIHVEEPLEEPPKRTYASIVRTFFPSLFQFSFCLSPSACVNFFL